MDKVAVLLSAYNGEKFLCEQIDSIMNQQNVDLDLYIRDDGSSDRTQEYLKQYVEQNDSIHLQNGCNLGVANSFMSLLYNVPNHYDYYAFADQDDIWEANKVQEAIRQLKDTGAALYGSNQECVDKYGNRLKIRYSEEENIHLTPISILNENMIAGCTMVFPQWFWQVLSDERNRPSESLLRIRIHDVWVAEVASVYGKITYDNRAFIKYRKHENNVVGAAPTSLRKNIATKVKKMVKPEFRNGRSKLAQEICASFPEQSAKYPELKKCAEANTCRGKLNLIRYIPTFCQYTNESKLGLLFKILSGVF